MRRGLLETCFRANIYWNHTKRPNNRSYERKCIQTGARYSEQPKHAAEYWQFEDAKVASKFLTLKDFELGIPSSKSVTADRPSSTHWYIFQNINNITTRVLKDSFGLDAAWKPNLRAPAKVEYVRCATDRNGDHLLISLHDYRLQENDADDLTGFVDDLSWINEIYESEPGHIDEESKHGQAGYDEPEMPERASLPAQQMVSKEVRFYYFPAANTVITIGTESASMVRTGRAAILNNRSQVRLLARLLCLQQELASPR
jgi:hypothetical protein